MREVIDTVPDADGDEIEVSVDSDGTPVLVTNRHVSWYAFDDATAERFDRAWRTAMQRREQARTAASPGTRCSWCTGLVRDSDAGTRPDKCTGKCGIDFASYAARD